MPKKKNKTKRKRIDPVTKKVRSIRNSLRKYGIRDISSEELYMALGDGVTCPYCKEQVTTKNVSVDHILPRSKGGADARENIQFTCKRCNLAKGNLLHDEFLALLQFLEGYPEMRRNVLTRLKGGAAFIYG